MEQKQLIQKFSFMRERENSVPKVRYKSTLYIANCIFLLRCLLLYLLRSDI